MIRDQIDQRDRAERNVRRLREALEELVETAGRVVANLERDGEVTSVAYGRLRAAAAAATDTLEGMEI